MRTRSPAGDRQTATYTTPNSTEYWGYFDYIPVGGYTSGKRVFQTLNKLTSGLVRTGEEMHYAYNSSGSLNAAAFAQSPESGQTTYTSSYPAASRCLAIYNSDPAGRLLSATHFWNVWGGSSFSSEAVLDNECTYENGSSLNRGLKMTGAFYKNTSAGSPNWTLDHSEGYSYDSKLDYLVGASYGDGLPNATPTWSYDAAANRTDTVTDNLNRPTTIGGVSCTSDILGNRLTFGSQSYGWDCLNRMTSYGSGNTYKYRADGMRISKVAGSSSTSYSYDVQMGIQDVDTTSGTSTVTDYGVGARGVDYIASTKNGITTVGYPIYDCHGNMTACLFHSGTNYYSLGNQRQYDAWGIIRSGASTGDPKGRYCASLGHKQDDESGLVHMRARYYEPVTGRFVSEDPSHYAGNWFAFAQSDPVNYSDSSGHASAKTLAWISFLTAMINAIISLIGLFFPVAGLISTVASVIQAFVQLSKDLGAASLQQQMKVLDSPEVEAAENTEAGPAVEAEATEAGADTAALLFANNPDVNIFRCRNVSRINFPGEYRFILFAKDIFLEALKYPWFRLRFLTLTSLWPLEIFLAFWLKDRGLLIVGGLLNCVLLWIYPIAFARISKGFIWRLEHGVDTSTPTLMKYWGDTSKGPLRAN